MIPNGLIGFSGIFGSEIYLIRLNFIPFNLMQAAIARID